MKKLYPKLLALVMLLAAMLPGSSNAQAPTLSYSTPQTYPVGTAISPLTPASSGVGGFTTNSAVVASGFTVPYAVAVDASGNVYVADKGNSAIMKIPVGGGSPLPVASGFGSPTGVAVDAGGNLFVADGGAHTLSKISAGTSTPVLFGSGLIAPYGVTADNAGNVYVADIGNASTPGSIKKISANGGTVTTLVTGINLPKSIAVDGSGNVYFVASNQLTKMGPTNVILWGIGGFVGVATDAAGNVYASGTNYQISEVLHGTSMPSLLATGFNFPAGMAVSASGTIYVAEYGNGSVDKITTPTGGYYIKPGLSAGLTFNANTGIISGTPAVAVAATNYTVTAYNASGGTSAAVNITVSGSTNLRNLSLSTAISPAFAQTTTSYTEIIDNATSAVQVTPVLADPIATMTVNGVAMASGRPSAFIPVSTTSPTTITVVVSKPGLTSKTYTITVTRATSAISYSTPHSYPVSAAIAPLTPTGTISTTSGYSDNGTSYDYYTSNGTGYTTFDAVGNLYITDFAGGTVQKIARGSNTAVTIGTGFNQPLGIVVDAVNNVYVADYGNNAVKEILASNGSVVSVGSGFASPVALALDKAGNLYVSNSDNGVINKLPVNQSGITVVGTGFTAPWGIAVDASGNLFVTDSNNGLYKITPTGTQTTLATGLNNPNGLTLDAAGNIYVANTNDGNIKEYPAGGGALITIGNPIIWGPFGIAIGPDGSLFATTGHDIIQVKPLGGAVISPALPTGLSFDKATGKITGTPTVVSPATDYTVTAFNSTGASTAKVNIAVAPPSSNANLANLTISSGTLSPAFAGSKTAYTDTVSNATTSITVTPTIADAGASIKVNGITVSSGAASGVLTLNTGNNTITIAVTAADGVTKNIYTVIVNRISNNPYLSNLTLSSGTLSPVFAAATGVYTASVNNAITSITVTPTLNNPNATVKVNGILVNSGAASTQIPLVDGTNLITIVVTAQDGVTIKTYKVTVTRLLSDVDLTNIVLGSGSLSPVFSSGNTSYTAMVTNATTSITITPTLNNPASSIKVNNTAIASGATSAPIALAVGNTTINIVVTAADGVTKKTYTVVVTRPSNNAYLTGLAVSSGSLNPAFAMTTNVYTLAVPSTTASITVTPTLNNPHATITVNGTEVAGGTASQAIPTAVGTTTITTIVTAQDGITQKTYTITVTRLSNNTYLSGLALSSGTLSPAFAQTTASYTASVSNAITTITVKPTLSNPNGTVTVNGTPVTSGTASAAIPLNVGANTITTVVTAQDGVTHKTYTITVTRASGSLNSLYLPGGEQTPLVSSLNQKVEASNILSPNGDGINDIWVVKNIAFYPDNTVTVYNRAGKTVFTRKGYTNDWNGAYRGSVLSEGTYYYLVDLGNGSKIKGFITVVGH